jgi:hypothetical protein
MGAVNGSVYVYDLRLKLDEPVSSIEAHDTVVNCVRYFHSNPLSTNTSLFSSNKSLVSNTNLSSDIRYQAELVSMPPAISAINSLTPCVSQMKKSNSLTFDGANNNASNPNMNGMTGMTNVPNPYGTHQQFSCK